MKESFFSAKQIVAMAVGTALYAALTIPFNVFTIPGAGGLIAVRPTVAIPMLFGVVFGPITGFVSGLIGNILSDFFSFGGFYWNWDIGNGLLGLVPGIAYFVIKRTDWTKAKTLVIVAVLAVVASVVGIGFSAMTDYIFQIGLSTIDSGNGQNSIQPQVPTRLTGLFLHQYCCMLMQGQRLDALEESSTKIDDSNQIFSREYPTP